MEIGTVLARSEITGIAHSIPLPRLVARLWLMTTLSMFELGDGMGAVFVVNGPDTWFIIKEEGQYFLGLVSTLPPE